MGIKLELTEKVFGRLMVLEDVGRSKNRMIIWRCQCECGHIVDVRSGDLRSGATQSCGCLHKKDLVGQKFGRLTIIEDVGRDKHSGGTQSCSCLQKERISETHSGERNHFWRGGITLLRDAIRKCTRYREWRKQVFQRDNFTCGHCHVRGGKLHAHHIKFFSTLMKEHNITTLEEAIQCEALWNTKNGITLCKKCHKKEHKKKPLTS